MFIPRSRILTIARAIDSGLRLKLGSGATTWHTREITGRYAKPLTDDAGWVDPKRQEASQDLSRLIPWGRQLTPGKTIVVERLQVAGLMAPDGEVDGILETVVNNLIVDQRSRPCRGPLPRAAHNATGIIRDGTNHRLSRGLLDVLPDEATLAAVLAHELAHIVLGHSRRRRILVRFDVALLRFWRSLPTSTSISIARAGSRRRQERYRAVFEVAV